MSAGNRVVDDWFVLTSVVPGQLQPDYDRSILYRRAGARWQPETLAEPIETLFTGSRGGDTIVAGVLDRGCCGWLNESSDRTILIQRDKSAVLLDEFTRFDNRNYDISFYSTGARLAPGNQLVALTIQADDLGNDIRLSSEGKANAAELTRIRAAIAEQPLVEVVQPSNPPKTVGSIPHAAVVGWLSDRELLVAMEGHLAVYDASGKKIRDTPIRLRSAADAFLR
jgi:hypothetical protein